MKRALATPRFAVLRFVIVGGLAFALDGGFSCYSNGSALGFT